MSPRPRFHNLDAAKREQILEAASEEFGTRGFEGASINRIIDKAGISKGAAYYYFDDKSDLYVTALQSALERMKRWAAGDDELAPEMLDEDNFWQMWIHWGTSAMHKMREMPWATQLLKSFFIYFESHRHDPGVATIWHASRNYTTRWIQRGQEVGVIRTDLPDDLFIEVFMGMSLSLDRWLFSVIGDLSDEDIERVMTMFVDLFRRVCEPAKEDS